MKVDNKIVYGLERLADVYKSLLWEKAKVVGLSPIQMQFLVFIANHDRALCNVTQLAKEFSLTKPTVSDAIKVLHAKGYLEKDFSTTDTRSYLLFLTPQGESLLAEIEGYAAPVQKVLGHLAPTDITQLYDLLTKVIYGLHQEGVIEVQRTCFACRFHAVRDGQDYCQFLQEPLDTPSIRLDCPDFVSKD